MLSTSNIVLILALIGSIALNILFFSKSTSPEKLLQPSNDHEVEYAFSQLSNDPKTLLLNAIGESTSTIDIAIYNFEDPEISEALIEASDRGVKVRVITDSEKSKKKNRAKLLNTLTDNGIDVKIVTSKKMHLKMTMVDERLVVFGSYNFTAESASENMEQLVSISNINLVKEWTDVFEKVWHQSDTETWSK